MKTGVFSRLILSSVLVLSAGCSLQHPSHRSHSSENVFSKEEILNVERAFVMADESPLPIIFGRLRIDLGSQHTTIRVIITPVSKESFRIQVLPLTSLTILEEFYISTKSDEALDFEEQGSASQEKISHRDIFRAVGRLVKPSDFLRLFLGRIPESIWREVNSEGTFLWSQEKGLVSSRLIKMELGKSDGGILEFLELSDQFREKPVLSFRYIGGQIHGQQRYPEQITVSLLRRGIKLELAPLTIRVP